MNHVTSYLAFHGFESELEAELKYRKADIMQSFGRLFIVSGERLNPVWAQDTWLNCQILEIDSVGDAVKKLKAAGKRWCSYHHNFHRRAELIQQQVFTFKKKKIKYLEYTDETQLFTPPDIQWGAWSLIEKNKIVLSSNSTSFLPLNEVDFVEDKVNPPSRAYLKLWEVFTLLNIKPTAHERVVDFGACPGGWTWVLANLGCHVLSVDKARIDSRLIQRKEVEYIKKDAFSLQPEDLGKIDWFFSDIICYPQDLLSLVNKWIQSGLCKKFVCTIKFQGETDFKTADEFLKIPNSKLVHLNANKHEITWIKL